MTWHDDAACRGHPADWFHASPGCTLKITEALRVCATCPVKAECRVEAERGPSTCGVWAGEVWWMGNTVTVTPRPPGKTGPIPADRRAALAARVVELHRMGLTTRGIKRNTGLDHRTIARMLEDAS